MKKYTDTLRQTSDAYLIRMVTSFKDQYEDDLISEALEELEERSISEDAFKEARDKAVHDRFVYDTKRNEVLHPALKALTFIVPVILTLILSRYYYSKGYIRKGDELATWTFWGFVMYMGLSIIFGILYYISNYH